MSTYSKEMLEAINGIRKTNLEDSSADAIIKLVLASQSGLATKTDLDLLRAEFKADMANHRTDFETLRADFETLRGDCKQIEAKVDALTSMVDSKLDGLKNQMIVWFLVGAAVLGGVFKTLEFIFS